MKAQVKALIDKGMQVTFVISLGALLIILAIAVTACKPAGQT